MVNSNGTSALVAGALGLLFLAGCGSGDWGYLSGTVTVNGQPVGPGSISLDPIDAQHAGSFGRFGPDGKYSVMSAGRKEGARTGEYRVSIQGGDTFGEEAAGPRPPSKIPPKYANPNTSGLTVTIESGTKTQDFDLKP